MHKKCFQMLALAVFAVAPATIFAAQQAQFIQSLDESEHQSAASSAISSAVSSSVTQAQVSVGALTEQQLNREYRLVLPNGENMMFPVRLLRHAGFFKPIIEKQQEKDGLLEEDGQKIADIPIEQYIATKAFDKENPHKITLKDLHDFLDFIDGELFGEELPIPSQLLLREVTNAYCVSILLVASYFDIPILFEAAKEHIIDCFEKGAISKNRILQLPDDIQTQVLSGYVEKSTIIKDFFNSPKRTADRTGILGTSILSSDGNFITEAAYNSFGHWRVDVKSTRTNKKLLSYALGRSLSTSSVSGNSSLNCSPDGTRIVFGFVNGKIWIRKINYNVETDTATLGDPLILQGHTDWINAVNYAPNGTKIISASEGCAARIWDANTGELIETMVAGPIENAIYSPDETKIALVELHQTYIWDVAEKKITGDCKEDREIDYMQWSADGRQIIYATCDEVILWNLERGQQISFNWCDLVPDGHATTPILFAELSSDGTELSASTSATTWTWDVPTPDLYLLTLPQFELVEKIITEKTIPDANDQNRETYESLSNRWKKILTDRFAPNSASTSAVGAEASSSSAAASAASSAVT